MRPTFSMRLCSIAVALGFSSPSVFAVQTTYGYTEENFFVGPTYYQFFGRYAPLPTEASSVGALASDLATRKGYIQEGGNRVEVDKQDPVFGDSDFGGVRTTTPGFTVSAFAYVGDALLPAPLPTPVRARSDFFANHVAAATSRGYYFYGPGTSGEQDDDGIGNNDYFLRTQESGIATSVWGDTWTAAQNMSHSVLFQLDGTIGLTDACPNALCGISLPGGTGNVRSLPWSYQFDAVMAVFDLNDIRPCEAISDDCDGESNAPVAVASVSVTSAGSANSDSANQDAAILKNGGTIAVDITGQLDFEAQAGHKYYILSEVKVSSGNGVALDFFNTFGLTGVIDPAGNLQSDAVINKGAVLVTAVPEPGALWLMLGGLAVLARRSRQRRVTGSCLPDQRAPAAPRLS